MKKKLFFLCLSIMSVLIASSQTVFNAVKVFELDTDSVYNFYIDTIGTGSGNAEFCFQTVTGKLVKTDSQGSVLSITDNPYTYFTVFDCDTLILNGLMVENTRGDSIACVPREGENRSALVETHYIAASSTGIYVYWGANVNSVIAGGNDQVRNLYDKTYPVLWTTHVAGLCVYQGVVYALSLNMLDGYVFMMYAKEQTTKSTYADVDIKYAVGLAGYQGSLYVYSNADKALYRLEQSNQTQVNHVSNSNSEEMISCYGLDGKRLESSNKGIQIRTNADGSTNKYIVK